MKVKKKYLIEVAMFLSYALFAMSWKAGDFLISSYGFSAGELATMTNAINIAKIIGSLSAAAIIFKFGKKNTFLISLLLIVMGGSLPMMSEYYQIFMMRFILGLGGAWILVTINPIIAELFEGKELLIVNGLNAVAFNAGLAVVLSLAGAISGNPSITLYLISSLLALCGILWWCIGNSDSSQINKKRDEKSYTLIDGFKEKFNWIFSLTYSGLLGFYLVSFTFMKPENVKYVIYAGMVGAVAGITFGTKVKDKVNFVRISAALQLLSAIGFLMLYESPIVKLIGIILGFMIFFPMASYVTLAYNRRDVTPEKLSITFSIFWAVSYAVSIFIVQIFGLLVDLTGGNTTPFIFILIAESFFFIGNVFFIKKETFKLEVV